MLVFVSVTVATMSLVGMAYAKKIKAEIIGLGDVSGMYSPFDLIPARYSGSFTVSAEESPLDLEIFIDQGKYFSGTRRLKGSKQTYLNYYVYKDAGYSQAWGWASPNGVSMTWTGTPVTLQFYLEVPAGQDAGGGVYDDKVDVIIDVL